MALRKGRLSPRPLGGIFFESNLKHWFDEGFPHCYNGGLVKSAVHEKSKFRDVHTFCPHRLVWPRTPAFQAGNTGSNPVGDTKKISASVLGRELG